MDIVYVSYNSEKWIEKCFSALEKSDVDLRKLHVWVFDNHSSDRTIEILKSAKQKWDKTFGGFQVMLSDENLGFGNANNCAAQKGSDDIICFFNIDTELFQDSLKLLQQSIERSPENVGMWELRQFPYEHPKFYDPITGETSWCSGASFAIRRSLFQQIGGFDPQIFMYSEDVDLSWRVRAAGYKLIYLPKVGIVHHAYQEANELKPVQYIYGTINNLLLRYKYGSFYDIILGHALFWSVIIFQNTGIAGIKKKLLQEYVKLNSNIVHILKKRVKKKDFQPSFYNFEYSIARDGAFWPSSVTSGEAPMVSVIVRTCGRPAILRETLKSLENQTYPNVEIIVAEDGAAVSRDMIDEEFAHLNIIYFATEKKVGRSKVGNLAMEAAHGKYLNFLDDDDLFFADHIETLVNALVSSKKGIAYSTGFEAATETMSVEPYCYRIHRYTKRYVQEFDPIMLCHHNYIPIQCIMFEKNFYTEYGGLDETLDALEDWDLWVKYSLHTDFEFVPKTTSIYKVPYNQDSQKKRQDALDDALISVRNKHRLYMRRFSVYDIAILYEKAELSHFGSLKWRLYGKFRNRKY